MKGSNLKSRRGAWMAVLALLLIAATAIGVYAAGEGLVRGTVPAGGGIVTTGGATLRSAFGQPAAGVVASAGNTECSGVLCPSAPQAPVASPTPPDGTPIPQGQSWLPLVIDGP